MALEQEHLSHKPSILPSRQSRFPTWVKILLMSGVVGFLLLVICVVIGVRHWTSRFGQTMTNKIGMEFIPIPSGMFMMGSDRMMMKEQPMHEVTIKNSFLLGKDSVTQAQWRAVMGITIQPHENQDDAASVEVNWYDAQRFIQALNQMNDGYVTVCRPRLSGNILVSLERYAARRSGVRIGTTSTTINIALMTTPLVPVQVNTRFIEGGRTSMMTALDTTAHT
jgi:Sulfatase-modifying factor enzyme 1